MTQNTPPHADPPAEEPIEVHLQVTEPDSNAAALLSAASGLPRARIAHAMGCGAVWLHHSHGVRRVRRRSASLNPGDELHLYYNPLVLSQVPPPATLVHDAGQWSVWWKPPGMRAQGSKWGDHTTLGRWAETHLSPVRESFIVHRLDLATSGVMLLAHDKKTAAALSSQFAARTVHKRYRAIVHGQFPAQPEGLHYNAPVNEKSAHSHVTALAYHPGKDQSLVSVIITTGRKHQIRQHLAGAGFAIVGDRLHQSTPSTVPGELPDLRLAAEYLAFDDPTGGARRRFERVPEHWSETWPE